MALLIGFYGNRLLWSVSKRGNTKLHNAIEWIIPQKGGKSTASDVKFTTFGVFVCHGGHTNRARGNYYAKPTNRRARLYLSLLAGLAVLCLAAALVWFARPQPETAAPRYLLKDSGGHVALYTADGIGPLATYDDLYTRLLPESDVLALQQGVFVADEAELQRRLEDYGL